MGYLLFIIGVFAAACGGAKEPAPEDAAKVQTQTPVWEDDVEDAAYKFYRSVSKTLLRTGQPQRATQTIRRLFKLKPADPEPRCLMGQAYVAMEQYDMALRLFKEALERDDKYAPAYSMMGSVLNLVGEHDQAIEAHAKAIELEEDNAGFYNNLGFSYYLSGNTAKAIDVYLAALDIDPGLKRVHNNLGFAYGKQGDLDRAKQHFKMAGLPAEANNNMGFVHETRGELERAYEYYVIALKQNPRLLPARENLTRICRQLGRPMPEIEVKYRKDSGEEREQPSPSGS